MVMGSGNRSTSSSQNMDLPIARIRERNQQELENLTLTTQPFKTLKFFVLAMIQYFKRCVLYLLAKGGLLMLLSTAIGAIAILVVTIDGPHEKHLEELSHYLRFALWWTALGVASSIGLGSGLHTFVLYLGPHIALFTIKAMQCGRVDLKNAPYDTIQLKRVPSWLDKECHEFGEPLFPFSNGLRVPLISILPQVQMEAILWGVGTALGELPPYFISRAAMLWMSELDSRIIIIAMLLYLLCLLYGLEFGHRFLLFLLWIIAASMSGGKLDAMQELDASSAKDNGFLATQLTSIKRWFLTHSQYLNFFTILVLASVPNPLFDLAGIMCGQFGIPFWKFFLATLIGKAIIKTHIQTVFIISVCNNQLLNWIENELIWVLSFIPGFASALPGLTAKLHSLREKYMALAPHTPSPAKVKNWDFSFAAIWNSVVWLMLLNFFMTIVTATAKRYLKKQQDEEVAALTNNRSASTHLD